MTELDAAKKSLACLAIAVPRSVYDDVMKKLRPIIEKAEKWENATDWCSGEFPCEASTSAASWEGEYLRLVDLLRQVAVYRNGSGEYCDICYEESAAHCSCCHACLGTEYENLVCQNPNCELAKITERTASPTPGVKV